MTPTWYELSFSADDAEEKSYLLFQCGVMGANFPDPHTIVCYTEHPDIVISAAEAGGFVHLVTKVVEPENWNATCAELWESICIGSISVSPVATLEAGMSASVQPNEIRIIPGLGFGTGHHMATRLALELLQLPGGDVRRVLDLGCGSGILAIAAALIFPTAEICAADIDPLALENAKDNVTLNSFAAAVHLTEGGIESVRGHFDVVVANIYAEVLVSIEARLSDILRPGGRLILSGIMNSLAGSIRSAFSSGTWHMLRSEDREEWCAFVFQKL